MTDRLIRITTALAVVPPVPPVTRTNFPAMRAASTMAHSYPNDLPKAVAHRAASSSS